MTKKTVGKRAARSDGKREEPLKAVEVQVEDLKTILGHDKTSLNLLRLGVGINLRKSREAFLELYGPVVDAELPKGQEDTELGKAFLAVRSAVIEHVEGYRAQIKAEEEKRTLDEQKAAKLEETKRTVRAKTEMADEIIGDMEESIRVVSAEKLELYADAHFGDVKAELEDKNKEENKGAEQEFSTLIATLERGRSLRNFVRWQRTINRHQESIGQVDERLEAGARKLEGLISSGELEKHLETIERRRNEKEPEDKKLDEEGLKRKVSEGMGRARKTLEKLQGYVSKPETILLTDINNGKRLLDNPGFKNTVPQGTVQSLVGLIDSVESIVLEKIELLNKERQALEELGKIQTTVNGLVEPKDVEARVLEGILSTLSRARVNLAEAATKVDLEVSDNVKKAHQELLQNITGKEDAAYAALIEVRVPKYDTRTLIKISAWERPNIFDCDAAGRNVQPLKQAASKELKTREDVERVAAQLFNESERGRKASEELEAAGKKIEDLRKQLESAPTSGKLADDLKKAQGEVTGKTKEMEALRKEHGREKERLETQVNELGREITELRNLAESLNAIADVSVEDQATWDRTVVLAGAALVNKGITQSNNAYQLVLDTIIVADWLSAGVEPTEDDLKSTRPNYNIDTAIDNIFSTNNVTRPASSLEVLETVAAIASLRASGMEVSNESIETCKQSV